MARVADVPTSDTRRPKHADATGTRNLMVVRRRRGERLLDFLPFVQQILKADAQAPVHKLWGSTQGSRWDPDEIVCSSLMRE